MPENDQQNKTEDPTSRKLEKAREEGNVAKSTEIVSVLLMVITVVVMLNLGHWIYARLEQMLETFFVVSGQGLADQENALEHLNLAMWYGFEMISPLLIGLFTVAILGHIVQTGVVFAPKVLEVKGSRLSPLKGFKKIFSMHGIVELVKGFSKI
jgi:flagellar biosynthetic protein FlhB